MYFLTFSFPKAEVIEYKDDRFSQSTYGGIGLIQNPTARFSNDGEFTFGISKEEPYGRLYSTVQFFPWMEVAIRYTEGTHKGYRPGMEQTWKDKGLDLKIKLLNERSNFPALAMGFRDLGGTGDFSGEYIVANKMINNFDFSLGFGTASYAGSLLINNPFVSILGRSAKRGSYGDYGGSINIDNHFAGEKVGIFGGFEYYPNISNLSFKVEYDSTDYSNLIGRDLKIYDRGELFQLKTRWNAAINYQYETSNRDKIDFSLGYLHGNTLYAHVAAHSNLNIPAIKKFIAPKETINKPYLEPFSNLNGDWQKYLSDLIMWQMGNVGFVTHSLIFSDTDLQVEISQGRFRNPVEAIDLAARILANNSPKNIKKLTVINIDQGTETLRASISRDKLVNDVAFGPLNEELLEFSEPKDIDEKAIVVKNDYLYPNFYWDVKPHALGTLQHQEKFYFWQLEALFHTEYSFMRGLYLSTDIGIDLANNYDDYTYHIPDGKLYHVRQNRRLYLTEGKSGIRRMALDYVFKIAPEVTGRFSAGILEWMYGGIGGEIIYKPFDKHWAVSADYYWFKQRDYDQKFSFLDFQDTTRFVNFYYDLPFYDLTFKTSIGKFLAQDKGIIVDVSRRFKSGATIGAATTVTNCDSACVGEGSFNKWAYFKLPMDLFYTKSSTRGKAGYSWAPLTKDSGQRLEPGNLYDMITNAPSEVQTLRRKSWSVKKILSGFSTVEKARI